MTNEKMSNVHTIIFMIL